MRRLSGGTDGPEWRLSLREAQVLALVCGGCSNKEIAALLGLTPGTAGTYVARLARAVGARNRVQLAMWGLEWRKAA
ncbi:MAG TPA: helix-turn-helix transcriptional regulator [Bryobacteraceae bacterium]|nr:helix-turn-helix transcriptional regulator [Bryobacteraceae bacterium]